MLQRLVRQVPPKERNSSPVLSTVKTGLVLYILYVVHGSAVSWDGLTSPLGKVLTNKNLITLY